MHLYGVISGVWRIYRSQLAAGVSEMLYEEYGQPKYLYAYKRYINGVAGVSMHRLKI
jgi:hypothetical protein